MRVGLHRLRRRKGQSGQRRRLRTAPAPKASAELHRDSTGRVRPDGPSVPRGRGQVTVAKETLRSHEVKYHHMPSVCPEEPRKVHPEAPILFSEFPKERSARCKARSAREKGQSEGRAEGTRLAMKDR